MPEKVVVTQQGLGLASVVFVVFLIAKLTHHIDWSWWWVTAPLWGGVALAIAIPLLLALLSLAVLGVITLIEKISRR